MSRPSHWAFVLALAAAASIASADTILLKDGQQLEGSLAHQGDGMVVQTADGHHISIQISDIQKVTLNSVQTSEEKASSAWTRAQAAIKQTDDLAKIIAQLEPIVHDFPTTATGATARNALALYKQMQAESWVRYNGQWMPPLKAEARQRTAVENVLNAEVFLRTGKLKDAIQEVNTALGYDERNTQALALGGLTAYRQNNLAAARSYFERLAAADDANLLAYNNLALIDFQQNNPVDGLVQFGKALQVAPDNRLLLDNIAAALQHYAGPSDVKPLNDLLRQYSQAEIKMEAVMAQQGLYRYAATWMTADQKDKLDGAVDQIKTRMAQLDGQYATATGNLTALEQDLRDTAIAYDGTLADYNYYSLVVLTNVNARAAYVDPYWYARRDATLNDLDALVRRRTALEAQRGPLTAAIRQMRGDAVRISAELSRAQALPTTSIIRLMEPGDVQNPPPPAAVQLPAFPTAEAPPTPPAPHPRLNLLPDPV